MPPILPTAQAAPTSHFARLVSVNVFLAEEAEFAAFGDTGSDALGPGEAASDGPPLPPLTTAGEDDSARGVLGPDIAGGPAVEAVGDSPQGLVSTALAGKWGALMGRWPCWP